MKRESKVPVPLGSTHLQSDQAGADLESWPQWVLDFAARLLPLIDFECPERTATRFLEARESGPAVLAWASESRITVDLISAIDEFAEVDRAVVQLDQGDSTLKILGRVQADPRSGSLIPLRVEVLSRERLDIAGDAGAGVEDSSADAAIRPALIRTPTTLTPTLRVFLERVAPGVEPVYVPVETFAGSEPNQCHENVLKQIGRHGGSIQHGWQIVADDSQEKFASVFHSVWRSPKGRLVDVSPQADEQSLLLPLEQHDSSQFVPGHLMFPAEEVEESLPGILMNVADNLAMMLLPNAPLLLMEAAEDLIGRNRPCYCGSGVKFKRCCRPMLAQRRMPKYFFVGPPSVTPIFGEAGGAIS